jgi:tetratricopeptide (TPR) repeat protein
MKNKNNVLDTLSDRLFSSTYQLTRIVILLGIVLVVAVISFGSYYYYDRYYRTQPKAAQVSLEQAEKAVRDDPQNIDKRLVLAETLMVNARWEEAIAQANEVMGTDPEAPYVQRVWLITGVSNAQMGNYSEAIDPLTRFVDARKDEDMPGVDHQLQSAAYYLGDSYLQLKDPQSAVAPLENAVNWSQTDADAMYKLGVAYAGIQEYEKAANMFHAATTFVPDYLEAYQAMAETYDVLKMPDLAMYARGMMAYSTKDYAKARDLLLKSAQARHDFAPTFAGLGRTYEALEDLPAAKSAYETALTIDQNNFTATNGLQRVEAMLKK